MSQDLTQYESWNQRNDYPDPPTCEWCGEPLYEENVEGGEEMHDECYAEAEAAGYFL